MEYLESLFNSLSLKFGDQLPKILGAIVVLLIGFWLAKIIKKIVIRLMAKTNIDERIASKMNSTMRVDSFVATLAYYLVVLYTLLVVLNLLGVESVLRPLEDMLSQFVGYIPNIIGAGVIGFAGYMIASIVSQATGFLSERLEGFGSKYGIDTASFDLSKVLSKLVFVIVFIPILIIALDTLQFDAISKPASEMLGTLLDAIPNIIAACIILGVAYFLGLFVTSIVSDLLQGLGVDGISEKIGISSMLGTTTLSSLVGKVLMFFIMFFAIIAAANKLDLGQVEVILTRVMGIAGKVFFGLIVLMGGVFISNIATKALSQSGKNGMLVPIARFAILGIFLAFALHTMGIAESIVNLAFGLTLGAIAVAFALSFGLGGREAAGNEMKRFFDNLRK